VTLEISTFSGSLGKWFSVFLILPLIYDHNHGAPLRTEGIKKLERVDLKVQENAVSICQHQTNRKRFIKKTDVITLNSHRCNEVTSNEVTKN